MQIPVIRADGSTSMIEADSSLSVANVLHSVQESEGIAMDQMRIAVIVEYIAYENLLADNVRLKAENKSLEKYIGKVSTTFADVSELTSSEQAQAEISESGVTSESTTATGVTSELTTASGVTLESTTESDVPSTTTTAQITILKAKEPWKIDDFDVDMEVGKGQFGTVSLARVRSEKEKKIVALKVLPKSKMEEHDAVENLQEIILHSRLRHPHVIELYGYFHDSEKVVLVMEYVPNGTLRQLMGDDEKLVLFDQRRSALYIHQLADALRYCHNYHVMHRDVKPENILLDGDKNLKLADFGCAAEVISSLRTSNVGTLNYMAPEMVDKQSHNERVDHFAVGLLLYEFFNGLGKRPQSLASSDTYQLVFPEEMPEGAKDLVQKLLVREPSQRASLEQVMAHSWVVEWKDKVLDEDVGVAKSA